MNGGNQGAVKMMLLNDDERFSTYGPTEPTVKILRRPTLEQHDRSITEAKPKAPMKSLRQREHEYAVSINVFVIVTSSKALLPPYRVLPPYRLLPQKPLLIVSNFDSSKQDYEYQVPQKVLKR